MCAILQLDSAPLKRRPVADHSIGGATHCVSTVAEQTPVQTRETELKLLDESLRLTLQYSTLI